MTTLTITHSSINSGNPVYIQAKKITQSIQKTNVNDPNANYSEDTPVVRVENKSIANPIYAISNIVLGETGDTIGGVTQLTQELLKDFLVLANDDSDPIILNYTDASGESFRSLHKYSGSRTTSIPVTFNGTVVIDSDVSDTNAKKFTVGSITLLETKKVS
jgi:hypothetical protein